MQHFENVFTDSASNVDYSKAIIIPILLAVTISTVILCWWCEW